MTDKSFRDRVFAAVARIPEGRVATYGQIAELAGSPGAARAVGNAIHTNTDPVSVPCHRVVDAQGRPGSAYGMGGPQAQLGRLAAEGVSISDGKADLAACGISIESHPLEPFLPAGAHILFLGSFPPPRVRWSMEFFYPNFQNDFWRIQGLVFFQNQDYFIVPGEKRFDIDKIKSFSEKQGLAFYDTASRVCRLRANASDDSLEILESSDIPAMLERMPRCGTLVTTGGKASEELARIIAGHGNAMPAIPPVGGKTETVIPAGDAGRHVTWYRLPSSSRAFPMSLERKAAFYRTVLLPTGQLV